MKDLAKRFLTEADQEKIKQTVRALEQTTSGEIVTMVVSASYHYPMASMRGAVAFTLPLSIAATAQIGQLFWVGSQNMWIFIGVFIALFFVWHEIVKRAAWLKRVFVSRKEMDAEVEEAALIHFFKERLYRTRDETGVLIFISVFEKKVWILVDRGIDAKVTQQAWKEYVDLMVDGIKNKRQAEAICQAVRKIGALLASHFPVKPDDADELDNLIIGE